MIETQTDRISTARSLLFVPGHRPDRFDKARNSGSDVVIIDLEDAVPPSEKERARHFARQWLESGNRAVIRVNAADTQWFERDCELASLPQVQAIMLPKAAHGSALEKLGSWALLIALIETAVGLSSVSSIAATKGVARLAIGSIDLALDLDMPLGAGDVALDSLRLSLTLASRAAGLPAPIDGVTGDFRNPDHTFVDMRRVRLLGFRGKLCIHPNQVAPIHAALRPSDEDVARAREIVAAHKASGGDAVAFDGTMIDHPVVVRAYRTLCEAAG
jgi:citrate lyase subunit beta/citryl-CoA lyase